MQKYNFKLQPLLNKELIYECECSRMLGVLRGVFQEENDKLEELKVRKVEYQKELKEKKQHRITPAELTIYEYYFVKLNYKINTGKQVLEEIMKKLRAVQSELAKIIKKRKTLEKLKDRGEEEFKYNLNLSLNKEMDEIGMTKFNKSRRPDTVI